MSCSTSRGINDNRESVQILATRIFDNVRVDLDRESLGMSVELPYSLREITPLYASGTGTFSCGRVLSISPRYGDNYADVIGDLELKGTLTYIYGGASSLAPCSVVFPYSARMVLPESSLWPFDLTIHYSFYADSIQVVNSVFSALVDGTVICYVTSETPMSVLYSGPIECNSISNRQVSPQNTFAYSSFYPTNYLRD